MKRKRLAIDVANEIAKRRRTSFLPPRTNFRGVPTQAVAVSRLRRRQALQPRVGGFTGIEKKFVDFTNGSDAFTLVWASGNMDPATSDSISGIAQGDGESQRDGRVCVLHSWFIKGFVHVAATEAVNAPVDDQLARVVVVWDKQTNGALLAPANVFDTIGSTVDVNSVKNLQHSARFTVLKDKTFRMPLSMGGQNEGGVNSFAHGGMRIPFKMGGKFNPPIRVNHTGTTNVIASVADNSIHVIGTAGAVTVLLSYRSRVRFTG